MACRWLLRVACPAAAGGCHFATAEAMAVAGVPLARSTATAAGEMARSAPSVAGETAETAGALLNGASAAVAMAMLALALAPLPERSLAAGCRAQQG